MQEGHPQSRAGVLQLVGAKGAAVVHIEPAGQPAFLQCLQQTVAKALKILGEVELGVGDQAGVIIDDGEQVALSQLALMDDTGTVHAIGLPQVVDQLCLEASAVCGQAHVLVQAMTLEQPIQAVLGGGTIGGDDVPRAGQLHQDRQTHRGHLAAQGHQSRPPSLRPSHVSALGLRGDVASGIPLGSPDC